MIDSDLQTGPGAAVVVPFSDWALAESFTAAHGGCVVRLANIPDDYLFGLADRPGMGPRRLSR